MTNFSKTYWSKNYSDPMSMDGIGNAKDHVRYLSSFFALEHVDISTIIDLGFGYGHLFRHMLKEFRPHWAVGIEPSDYAFKKVKIDKLRPVPSTKHPTAKNQSDIKCLHILQNAICKKLNPDLYFT